MVATSIRYHYAVDTATTNDNWGIVTGTSTGTSDIQLDSNTFSSAANFGIAPKIAVKKPLIVPATTNVPRKHKDKNGCVKKSYWETQPIEIGNYGFAGVGDLGAFNISTSGVSNMTMGDTDDSASVRISSAST